MISVHFLVASPTAARSLLDVNPVNVKKSELHYNVILYVLKAGASERILDWVGRNFFIGDKKIFLRKFFDPQGGFSSNIG